MRKLVKYLRPFIWSILAIFVLLLAQAMADLSLPGYMSRIVNVGIQQNGIENAVPQAIRDSEFGKVTLFMTEEEKTRVLSDYIILDRQALAPVQLSMKNKPKLIPRWLTPPSTYLIQMIRRK
jgi:ATP-binding cassette subfamily B protein